MSTVNTKAASILLIMIFGAGFANASRIAKPGDPNIRCNNEELTQGECEEDRRDAIAGNCVTQQELQEIISYNGCPVCKKGRYKGWCAVGCFVRGTKLLVLDSVADALVWTPVENIVQNHSRYHMIALDRSATRSNLEFVDLPIRFTVVGPELKPLVIIKTENQRTLGLSSEHAVVLSNGNLIRAELLRVGDSLISSDGSVDVIVEIARPNTDDDVFNLAVETEFEQSHLILAEGLLVGDQYLQGANRNATILN